MKAMSATKDDSLTAYIPAGQLAMHAPLDKLSELLEISLEKVRSLAPGSDKEGETTDHEVAAEEVQGFVSGSWQVLHCTLVQS